MKKLKQKKNGRNEKKKGKSSILLNGAKNSGTHGSFFNFDL